MKRLKGIIVSEGLARGEAFVVDHGDVEVPVGHVRPGNEDHEVRRFERAVATTRREISQLEDSARDALGGATEIIGTYLHYLSDERGLIEPVRCLIRDERYQAAYAVYRHFRAVERRLSSMSQLVASRVSDLTDIKRRILANLQGRGGGMSLSRLPKRVILVADDLTPTQTAALDRDRVLAIATDIGGPASHTAILARHLGLPALVGLGSATRAVRSGSPVIIDALRGHLIIDPGPEELRAYEAARRRTRGQRSVLQEGEERAHTKDGAEVTLYANIDSARGAGDLPRLGVQGVGLFRTEFLFLGRREAPDEDAQVAIYRKVLEGLGSRTVTMRTMDFGADKWDSRVGAAGEPNPFLGLRAIRLSFRHEPLFRLQLRALLRAAVYGSMRIMFPLVNDTEDFLRAKEILVDVARELTEAGIEHRADIPVGAMIETPAACMVARSLIREADFFSLGTNDLTQYVLAVDRTNPHVYERFAPHHPAVLGMVQMAVQAAREAGKPLSACGEMAGTPLYTPVLLGLGVTTLSMAPRILPQVVEQVRKLRLPACRRLVDDMLAATGAQESESRLREFVDRPSRSR